MPMGENERVEGMRLVLIDLCALGGTLLLETGVVGITLADAGQVVAWTMGEGLIREVVLEEMKGMDSCYLPYHQR